MRGRVCAYMCVSKRFTSPNDSRNPRCSLGTRRPLFRTVNGPVTGTFVGSYPRGGGHVSLCPCLHSRRRCRRKPRVLTSPEGPSPVGVGLPPWSSVLSPTPGWMDQMNFHTESRGGAGFGRLFHLFQLSDPTSSDTPPHPTPTALVWKSGFVPTHRPHQRHPKRKHDVSLPGTPPR